MEQKLYLGVARQIITPPIGSALYGYRPDLFSTDVADELTATAFYFRQEDRQALMVSITVCELHNDVIALMLESIEKELGIGREHCQLHATHTHSGPNTTGSAGWGDIDWPYCRSVLIPRVLEAARQAMLQPRAVQLGVARGDSYVGINRDELSTQNTIRLGQNPWGCFDPKMTVASFRAEDGSTVANLIHYATHGTCAGQCTAISRDWSGVMTDALEEKTGGITAFFNGPEGDIGPRLPNGETAGRGTMEQVYFMGRLAARDALRIYDTIEDYTDAPLRSGSGPVKIPLQPRIPEALARQELEKYKNETVNWDGHLHYYYERVLSAWEKGIPEEEHYTLSQTVIALGSLVFAAFPYELYCQIGMRLGNAFRETVLSLALTNGDETYFVSQDAICRPHYGVSLFQTRRLQAPVDNADWYLLQCSIENITRITGFQEAKRKYNSWDHD